MNALRVSIAAKVALIYFVMAAAWILLSDKAVEVLAGGDAQWASTLQSVKGLVFVALTTAVLFVVVRRLAKLEARFAQMEAMFAVSEKLEVVGSFAASTAHDINNMLMVVRGMMELAKLDQKSGLPLTQERIEEIEKAVVNTTDVVKRLSAFVRGSNEKLICADMGVLLNSFEPLLRQAASRRVDFKLEVPESLADVSTQVSSLEQALLGLVVNARAAMSETKDARLWIKAECCTLRRHVSIFSGRPRSGEFVRIDVIDTGPGVPEHLTVQIFEPFYTTKEPSKGTGLGLPSVMRTMQQHGGWVALESRVGGGCRFSLYLPVVAADPVSEVE